MIKKTASFLLYLVYLVLIVGVILEILLRIFNPLPQRLVGDQIVLPKNQKYFLPNKHFTKISHNATHTKNGLGFRGEDWTPEKVSGKITILTIGGSTTECFQLDDKKAWPYLLEKQLAAKHPVWLNNAGLNGHSTVGHLSLTKTYLPQIKPDYALVLAGINDVALVENGGSRFDAMYSEKSFKYYFFKVVEKSRFLNLLHSLYRSYQAYKTGLDDKVELKLDASSEPVKSASVNEAGLLDKHGKGQAQYISRLKELVSVCRENGTKPVLITQPLLFGPVVDPLTKINLAEYPVSGANGEIYWKKLELYNHSMREVAKAEGVQLIDLANELPKSSELFYDDMHFSDKGCAEVSRIIAAHLNGNLTKED